MRKRSQLIGVMNKQKAPKGAFLIAWLNNRLLEREMTAEAETVAGVDKPGKAHHPLT